jgi:hypothetical protein
MAVVTTKSPSIINWDASPIFIPTTGEGCEGPLRVVNDSLTSVVGDSIASIYRFCRIPTNAKIKKVLLNVFTASTAGAGDIEIAFSDSATDGTQPSLAGGIVQITGPADNKLFVSAQSLTATQKQVDITFNNIFTAAHQNLPLWQVLVNLGATQFVADPGGFFDIVMKLTTAVTVTAGIIAIECDYVE